MQTSRNRNTHTFTIVDYMVPDFINQVEKLGIKYSETKLNDFSKMRLICNMCLIVDLKRNYDEIKKSYEPAYFSASKTNHSNRND